MHQEQRVEPYVHTLAVVGVKCLVSFSIYKHSVLLPPELPAGPFNYHNCCRCSLLPLDWLPPLGRGVWRSRGLGIPKWSVQARLWSPLRLLLGGRLWHIWWFSILRLLIKHGENQLFRRKIVWIWGLIINLFVIQSLILTVIGVPREYDILRFPLAKDI